MKAQDAESFKTFFGVGSQAKSAVNSLVPKSKEEELLKESYLKLSAIFGEQLEGELTPKDYARISQFLDNLLDLLGL